MRNPIRFIRKAGFKSLMGGVALAVAVPTVALAANPFTDVPADQWFTDAVDWAYNNDITTGKTPTTFNGDDNVTRYESVTFLQRYDTNIVQPALEDLQDAETVDGLEANEMARVSGERSDDIVDDWDGSDQTIETTITAPTNGFLLVEYTATVTTDLHESATGTNLLQAVLGVGAVEAGSTYAGLDFDAHFRTNFQTLNISAVVPVVAGDYTVSGITSSTSGFPAGGLAFIYDQSVTALFVPFDGNGLSPA